jgi:serine/threonine protein kinase
MNIEKTMFAETRVDPTREIPPDHQTHDAPVSGPRIGTEQLITNYQGMIRDRAIYYPVAYRLERILGQGRQGIVFLGLRQGARGCTTHHAIKLYDPGIYRTSKKYWTDMGRIAHQISRLQTVNSPYLVSRDAYEETNGIGYVQMENIDGVDLRYLLDGTLLQSVKSACTYKEWCQFTDIIFRLDNGKVAIQPGVAIYILRGILRGLEVLHDMDYVHSDIKPSNIMINRLGNPKIVDYGRATRVSETMSFLIGTPLYMAPETHRRNPNVVQSDIFSLGLVALEMLRGEPLLDVSNYSEEDLLRTKEELPARLDSILPPHILENEILVSIIRRFIDPDPTRRFGHAGDAEAGENGLRVIHKQLAQLGQDAEYGRELKAYMDKLMTIKSK